jgi:hypothetical protein
MTHQQTYSYPPTDPDQPDRVTSEPVPVPPTAEAEDRDETDSTAAVSSTEEDPAEDVTDRVPEETLDDQGTFEDPVLSEDRTDPDDLTAVTPSQDDDVADEDAPRDGTEDSAAIADTDRDEPEFHEPAAQPTAFGAATVGGAAAAAAMAGPSRDATDERDRTDERDLTDEPYVTDERDEHDKYDEAAVADADERVTDAEPQAEMLPGDVPAEPVTALWGEDTAQSFRDRWRDVQLRFVDDPQGAARDAQSLVDDAVQSLTTALTGQRDQLGEWTSTDGADTEQFRVAVRQYRDFLDRLLGL